MTVITPASSHFGRIGVPASRIALCLLAATPPAQPIGPYDRPSFLYDQGTTHYREGHFRQAIEEFLEADRLRPSPALAYDAAQTYEKLGDPEHAAQYYRLYLERQPGAADRPVVEATLRNLDAWVEARRAANEDPGAQFRKIGAYTFAASVAIGALGFGFQVAGDAEPHDNQSAASAFHTTADTLFVTAAVGLLSSGVFFLLGNSSYATKQTAVAMASSPGGFALTF